MSRGQDGFQWHALTLAAVVAVVVGFVGFVLYQAGSLPTFNDPYTIKARVPSASLLTPGARVTVAGAEVGSVAKIERADAVGRGSQLTLEFTDTRVTPLPVDSIVAMRTRSQVGENYISVVVGRDSRTVPDNGLLPASQAEQLVEVDQVLDVLSGPRKNQARRMLAEFGAALTGRGEQLNQTLSALNPTVDHGSRLVDVLRRQKAETATLVDKLGRVTTAVGDRGAAIETIAKQGVTALRAIGDRDQQLAATLRELPPTLASIQGATTTIGNVSVKASPVVANLARAVADARTAVQDLAPAAKDGRGVVAALGRATPALDRLLRSANRATKGLPGALPGIKTTFCQLNPALRYLLPYKDDILQSAFHLGSGSNSYDATGHLVRLVPILNENSLSGAPPTMLSAAHTLLQSGTFFPQKVINYKPFMEPGEIGKTAATSGSPSGPADLAKSGYKYPRVTADC